MFRRDDIEMTCDIVCCLVLCCPPLIDGCWSFVVHTRVLCAFVCVSQLMALSYTVHGNTA